MNRSKSLIAVGIILCVLLSFLTPFVLPGTARGQPADSPWPMFGQNPQRTGRSPYSGPEVPYQKWSFTTEYSVLSSPAIGADGTIYVGSDDYKLYAINPDGSQKWSFITGDWVSSSPAIGADGTIYVGSGHNLYAINPDGSERWRFTTGYGVTSSPAIGADGTIYVGSHDDNLYAINPDGSQKWSFTTADSVASSPAIGADGTIYVGSYDDKLYALNPDGSEKWRFTTGIGVSSSPAIGADGTIYVGSGDRNLYAINPDGSQKWSFTTADSVASSPAIGADGTIYVGSSDNKLYAINPDGSEKWSFTTGRSVSSSPAIGADGTIYVGSWDKNLYAINPNGSQKWSFTTRRGSVLSSPAIGADGTIYVGSHDDKLYAITEVPDYNLAISSTDGGSVTEPGEGEFTYAGGTVVDLVAEAEEGYRFVNWIGDVNNVSDVCAAATNITMDDNYSITANFVSVEAGDVGIKTGDWIKVDYKISGWPAGEPYPEWLKLEFLSVEGTSATTRATLHMSDGTEQSDTMPVDVVAGGEALGFSGGVISANLTTGDSVYMTGYGDVAIAGETTRTYAGARRTVVYASISQSVPYQGDIRLTYYWDKLTGVIVEASTTYGDITATAKATETNMWEATTIRMPWWLWTIGAAAVVAVALVIYLKRRRMRPGASP